MTKEEVIEYAESIGFVRDRWGHYQRTAYRHGRELKYRFKIQKCSVRYEQQRDLVDEVDNKFLRHVWVAITWDYLTYLSVEPETGIIRGDRWHGDPRMNFDPRFKREERGVK